MYFRFALIAFLGLLPAMADAFEHTKVLPKGVRSVNMRRVETTIDTKTDQNQQSHPLADPLMKDLQFKDLSKDSTTPEKRSLEAFLNTQGISVDDTVGSIKADMRGNLSVFAPIVSYGISNQLTFAVAVPFYSAKMNVDVGFEPTQTTQDFIDALSRDEINLSHKGEEVATKLNDFSTELDSKLATNGYQSLDKWEKEGTGDVTFALKNRFYGDSSLASAYTAGFVMPNGHTDDPNILHDIGFSDGQWDVFGQLAIDETFSKSILFNQYAKYTAQLPGDKRVRLATEDETLEVPVDRVRFKLGDKVDAGTSVQWLPSFGLTSGIGYNYFRKYRDIYRDLPADSKEQLESGTEQLAHKAEVSLGYSTVPLYQTGSFPVPFSLALTYHKQLSSQNMPVTDLAQIDFSMFF